MEEEKVIEQQSSPDGSKLDEAAAAEEGREDVNNYPSRKIVVPAMVSIYLAVFLIALDRTILGTAVPAISNEFKSFGDIAWYEAGFLLPLCTLQLSFGRVYTFYPVKWVLAIVIALFELGSLVCALAPTSKALIVGRVITGIGGGGIGSGSLVLINVLIPLRSRPKYTGGLGAMFGIASIVGPLLGGAFTSVTWRWCFWINVPIGAISLVVLALVAPNRPPPLKAADSLLGKANQLDPAGFLLAATATTCFLFALQWGGTQYPWNDGRIIALFVLAGVLGIAFVASQAWRKENATIPLRIVSQRSILTGSVCSVAIGALIVVYSFYLPIWFQAIKGYSPESSGLALLGLLLSNVVAVGVAGGGTSGIGYYTPFAIVGSAIAIVGAALITLWEVDTGSGMWIGYQVVTGFGLGLIFQVPNIAAQTVLSDKDLPIGVSWLQFVQFLSGTVFVTTCQTLLENKLVQGLEGKIQGFNPGAIANSGATSLRQLVPPDKLALVLDVYNDSLRSIWYLALGLCALAFLASFAFEWKSVKAAEKAKSEDQIS